MYRTPLLAGSRCPTLCDSDNELDELVVAGADTHAVQAEKDEAAGETGSLLTVHERVVPDQVEEVRGGLLVERWVVL